LVLLVFFVVGAIQPDDRGGWAHRSLGPPADSSSLWWPAMRIAARTFSQPSARPAVKVDVVEARGRGRRRTRIRDGVASHQYAKLKLSRKARLSTG
jgi:hypothetical protein